MLLFSILLVSVLIACARGDCDACVSGRCHSRRTIMQGFRITDQLAIDRTGNILYVQLNGNQNTAISLDHLQMQVVQTVNTKGMAVDQNTRTLYTGHAGVIYGSRYEGDSYTTEVAFLIDRSTASARLSYADTLYTVNEDGTCAYFRNDGNMAGQDNIPEYKVTDLAKVINTTTWVFVANNNVYKYIWSYDNVYVHLIAKNTHLIATDKYGDVYIADASQRVISKLDRETEELVNYASYETGAVEDFVFDKDNNMVFRDADGSLARWVPENARCVEKHGTENIQVPDDLVIKLLRGIDDITSPIVSSRSNNEESLYYSVGPKIQAQPHLLLTGYYQYVM